MYPVWLMAMTAPPVRGTFSSPSMVNCSPSAKKSILATPMTGR